MTTKINDMEEFAFSVTSVDPSNIKSFFEDRCTESFKNEIFLLSKDGSLQSAIRTIGDWYNLPVFQIFIG